MISNPDDP